MASTNTKTVNTTGVTYDSVGYVAQNWIEVSPAGANIFAIQDTTLSSAIKVLGTGDSIYIEGNFADFQYKQNGKTITLDNGLARSAITLSSMTTTTQVTTTLVFLDGSVTLTNKAGGTKVSINGLDDNGGNKSQQLTTTYKDVVINANDSNTTAATYFAALTPDPTPSVFTLTTGIDVATSNNFYGVGVGNGGTVQASTTLNAGDNLTGITNAVADLTFANTGGATTYVGTRFNNISTIKSTSVGTTGSVLDLSLATGVTSLVVNNSSVAMTYTNVSQLAGLAVNSNAGNVTVQYLDSLVTPTAVATVAVNGMINGTAGVALTIGGVTGTTGFSAINIAATGTNRISSLATSTDNDQKTLTITGAGNLQIDGVTSTAIATLNLSGSTGTNIINLSGVTGSSAGATAVTGGTGNDTVVFTGGNFTTLDTVSLGGGNNTIGLSYTAANGAGATFNTAQASAFNASTNVQNIAFVASAAVAAGESTLRVVDLGLLNTTTSVNFAGLDGVYALGAGQTGSEALAVTGAVTGETLNVQDISGLAGTVGNGAQGNAAADGLDISSIVPFQSITLGLIAEATNATGIQIAGGAAGTGQSGVAAGIGGAAGLGLDGLGNISTLNIISNGNTVANSIIGGAGGTGGTGVGAAGGAAGIGIDNVAGLNVNISGAYDFSILGGAAGAAGAAGNNNAGGAGGARAYGFTAAVNVNASTLTGKLNIEGSAVGTAGDVITGGLGADTINGSSGADFLNGGAGSDIFEYLTGTALEIANTAGGTQAQLGALTSASNIESISGFVSGADKVRINTSAAFFANDTGAEQVSFTTTSTATVAKVSLGNITASNMNGFFTALNAAVTGTASTNAVASSYLVTVGTVSGGLANASNQTFLVINNGVAALNNLDDIINVTGATDFVATDFAFAVV